MNLIPEKTWNQFRNSRLKESPLGIYYTNDKPEGVTPKEGISGCMMGLLQNARRKETTVYFDKTHFGCPGGLTIWDFLIPQGPISNIFFPVESRVKWR